MNYKNIQKAGLTFIAIFALWAGSAGAEVSLEEAAKLQTILTPLGAERAGNAQGTIPAWEGGYTTVDPSFKQGGTRNDPFASDKVLFSITAQNMDQYADRLTEGTKEMFRLYPDTYRLDVYQTRRTASAPQWVYANTAENAVKGIIVEGNAGPKPANVYGGIPFPIPQNGEEIMWNHLLSWRGSSSSVDFQQFLIAADGKQVMVGGGTFFLDRPYHHEDSNLEQYLKEYPNEDYRKVYILTTAPPLRAGSQIVGGSCLDATRASTYVYLPGQRRVRKLPNACCDTPSTTCAGIMTYDELYVWDERIDRFNWKIMGKKEMYIPYNTNRYFTLEQPADAMSKHHLNPDHLRWELHRVWVVEAELAPGKRHQLPKGRYYLDEDTWLAVLGDRWDSNDQLAKMMWGLPYVLPDMPGVCTKTSGFYDFTSKAWFVLDSFIGLDKQIEFVDNIPKSKFSPRAMAGRGVK